MHPGSSTYTASCLSRGAVEWFWGPVAGVGAEDQARRRLAGADILAQKTAMQNLTRGRAGSYLIGGRNELDFRLRLLDKGYYFTFIPAVNDVGVDCVVLTTKGWRGIQIKTAERDRSTGGRENRKRKPRL